MELLKMPHLREMEISRLLQEEPILLDSTCEFVQKMLIVNGNINIMLTTMEEYLHFTLNRLWDSGMLTSSPNAKHTNSDHLASTDSVMKDKQIQLFQEANKSLRAEITRLKRASVVPMNRSTSMIQPITAMLSGGPTSSGTGLEVPVDPEPAYGTADNQLDHGPSNEDELSFFVDVSISTDQFTPVDQACGDIDFLQICPDCDSFRQQLEMLKQRFESSTARISPRSYMSVGQEVPGSVSTNRTSMLSTARLPGLLTTPADLPNITTLNPLVQEVIDQGLGTSPGRISVLGSINRVLDPSEIEDMQVPVIIGGNGDISDVEMIQLRMQEVDSIKEREIADEERIHDLLVEIIEKDEIIETFHDEIDRLTLLGTMGASAAAALLGSSPRERKSARGIVDNFTIATGEGVITSPAEALSGRILEERWVEIKKLRIENERLGNLISQITISSAAALDNDSRHETIESGVQSDMIEEKVGMDCDDNSGASRRILSACIPEMHAIFFPGNIYDPNEDILALERKKTAQAIEESRKVKICLGELERQITALQHQLRQAGVSQHHIESALTHSGLVHLVRSNRVGVFERLYQDALNRMIKMDKIRERFREIQRAEYLRLNRGIGSAAIPVAEISAVVPIAHPRRSPSARIAISGELPSNRRISASGGCESKIFPERYLSAHSVLNDKRSS